MRALSTLLGAVARKRGITGLAIVAMLVFGASAAAGAAVLRDRVDSSAASAAALAASCGVDEFEGAALDEARWDVLRPAGAGPTVAGGKLSLELRTGDLINQTANAENVVLQDAPAGGWTATTKFNISEINVSGEQAGIVLWKSEGPPRANNSFGKVMFIQTLDANTRVIESIWTDRGNLANPIADSRAAVPTLPANADVLMRLRSDGVVLTAEFSTDDGATWTQAGQPARYSGDLRVGLVAIQGSSGNGGMVPFERFELECAPQLTASAASGDAPFEVDFSSTGTPAGADLAWDFGDGTTAAGGTQQTHTFAQPGVYRVRLASTTAGGRKLTGSTVVTVEPALASCMPQNDEFNGNELDPKWQILHPRDTGLTLSGGHLRLQAYGGDMHGTGATASNVVIQDVPAAGAWTATTRIDISGLTRPEGGEQAGMVLWRGEGQGVNNFAKVVYNRRPNNQWWVERSNTVNSSAQGTTNTPLDNIPNEIYLRIRGAADGTVQPERSLDGQTWTAVGAPFQVGGTGPLKVGLTYFSNDTLRKAAFDYLRIVSNEPASDEFDGTALDRCKWPQIVREDAEKYRVKDGKLEIDTTPGEVSEDPEGPEASNLIGQPVPADPWQATAKIELDTNGNGQQAGLLLYGSDANWIKVVLVDKGDLSQVELVRYKDGQYILTPPFKVDVPKTLTEFLVRMRSDGTTASAQYSADDGATWADVGTPRDVSDLGGGHLGPLALHGNAPEPVTAKFDYVHIEPFEPTPGPECTAPGAPEEDFTRLWNGTNLDGWSQAGPGNFEVVDDGAAGCRLLSRNGLGLFWYDEAQYDEFVLRLQFKTEDATDNSGVFVRFPNPGNDPGIAISQGHEIQIREGVQGDGENQKTGSIYNFDREDARNANPPGEWNDYEIRYEDDTYTVTLNGDVVNTWENTSNQAQSPGFIGIQNHGVNDAVSFRNIRIQELEGGPEPANLFNTIGITRSETRQNSQIHGNPTPYSLPAEEMPPSRTVGPPDDALDDVPLRMPDTSGTQPNLAAFRGQTLTLREEDQKQFSKIHFFGTTTDGGPAGGDFVLRFADNSTQSIQVRFRDWCAAPQDTPEQHAAIGPLTQRYRTSGGDGATCSIYHVPADVTAGKTLVSVTLPPNTTPAGTFTQAYLMALTLEEPGGAFETPDLSGQLEFPDDQTAPVTTSALDPAQPDGNDDWYKQAVQVTLDATDAGGSGVETMNYRINGGPVQDYTDPFEITTEGQVKLEYRSIDGSGNAEGFKSVDLKVDATAPDTTLALDPDQPRGTDGWHDGVVQLTLTSRDGRGSGVQSTEYRVGSGDWQPYTGVVTLDDDGVHDIHYRATDRAGNVGAEQQAQVKVDAAVPVTTARLTSAAAASGGVYRGPVTVTVSVADGGGSGVAAGATEYRLDSGAWRPYGGPIVVSALGGHLVEYRSRDRAGNLENVKELVFTIAQPQGAPGPGPGGDDDPPDPQPFVGLAPRSGAASVASVLRSGLQVRASCVAVGRGTLTLKVTRKVARRLGLKRTTLATRAVRCGGESRLSVRLKPGSKARKALRRARGSFSATLRLQMTGDAGRASDTLRVVLRGKGRRG